MTDPRNDPWHNAGPDLIQGGLLSTILICLWQGSTAAYEGTWRLAGAFLLGIIVAVVGLLLLALWLRRRAQPLPRVRRDTRSIKKTLQPRKRK